MESLANSENPWAQHCLCRLFRFKKVNIQLECFIRETLSCVPLTAKTNLVHQLQPIFFSQLFCLRFSFYVIFLPIGICQLDNDV